MYGKHTGGWQLVPLHTCREQFALTCTDEINTTKEMIVHLWKQWEMRDRKMLKATSKSVIWLYVPAVKVIPHVLWQHHHQVVNVCCFVGWHTWRNTLKYLSDLHSLTFKGRLCVEISFRIHICYRSLLEVLLLVLRWVGKKQSYAKNCVTFSEISHFPSFSSTVFVFLVKYLGYF